LIGAAQRVEHYEIAAYGCLRTYALLLGNTEADRLLQQTLPAEEATDQALTALGEGGINQAGVDAWEDEWRHPERHRQSDAGSASVGCLEVGVLVTCVAAAAIGIV